MQTLLPCSLQTSVALSLCLVPQLFPSLCDSMHCSPPGSSVHGVSPGKTLEWTAMPSSGDLPNPGIKPRSPALQADSLLSELPEKPEILEWKAYPFSRGTSWPVIKLGSPALQADSLPAELPRNHRHTSLLLYFSCPKSSWKCCSYYSSR